MSGSLALTYSKSYLESARFPAAWVEHVGAEEKFREVSNDSFAGQSLHNEGLAYA